MEPEHFFHGSHLKPRNITIPLSVVCLVLVLVALFLWPSLYRYDHIVIDKAEFPVRIHRITGTTETLFPTEWQKLRQTPAGGKTDDIEPKGTVEKPDNIVNTEPTVGWLSGDELQSLKLHAELERSLGGKLTRLNCNLYNGSTWNVMQIVVAITVHDRTGKPVVVDQHYKLTQTSDFIKPLKVGYFFEHTEFPYSDEYQLTAKLVSAAGMKQ